MMNLICISSPQVRRSLGIITLIIGFIIIILSTWIPGFISVFLAALIFVISLIFLISGLSIRGGLLSVILSALGLIGCLISLSLLRSPDLGVSVLGMIIGIWMIFFGAAQIGSLSFFRGERVYSGLLLCAGIITLLLGIYLIIAPQDGMQIVTFFIGCYLVGYGIISLIRRGE